MKTSAMGRERVHEIKRLGNFDREFRSLDPTKITPENPLSDKVNGLRFYYMQSAKEFLAVGVEGILLRAPVLVISERHTDGKGFAANPHLGDESAMHLLVDMIIANPERRDALGQLLHGLGAPADP